MGCEQYERQGYVVVPGVLDASTVARARADLATVPGGAIRTAPLSHSGLVGLVGDERLAAVAEALLGGPVEVFGCTYLVKEAGTGPPAGWHQDGGPWQDRLDGAPAVTLWVALDPSTPARGGMRVLPGSHRGPLHPLRPTAAGADLFGVALDPSVVDGASAEDLVLEPGDVSAHHPNLVHGSGPNLSDHPRRAVALRYRR